MTTSVTQYLKNWSQPQDRIGSLKIHQQKNIAQHRHKLPAKTFNYAEVLKMCLEMRYCHTDTTLISSFDFETNDPKKFWAQQEVMDQFKCLLELMIAPDEAADLTTTPLIRSRLHQHFFKYTIIGVEDNSVNGVAAKLSILDQSPAHHRLIGDLVVIKCPKFKNRQDSDSQQEIIQSLTHEALVGQVLNAYRNRAPVFAYVYGAFGCQLPFDLKDWCHLENTTEPWVNYVMYEKIEGDSLRFFVKEDNAAQDYYRVIVQLSLGLAAVSDIEFNHYDAHGKNIMIRYTGYSEKEYDFEVLGRHYKVKSTSMGGIGTFIDFGLSRIRYGGKVYNSVDEDHFFTGVGIYDDYVPLQDVYRIISQFVWEYNHNLKRINPGSKGEEYNKLCVGLASILSWQLDPSTMGTWLTADQATEMIQVIITSATILPHPEIARQLSQVRNTHPKYHEIANSPVSVKNFSFRTWIKSLETLAEYMGWEPSFRLANYQAPQMKADIIPTFFEAYDAIHLAETDPSSDIKKNCQHLLSRFYDNLPQVYSNFFTELEIIREQDEPGEIQFIRDNYGVINVLKNPGQIPGITLNSIDIDRLDTIASELEALYKSKTNVSLKDVPPPTYVKNMKIASGESASNNAKLVRSKGFPSIQLQTIPENIPPQLPRLGSNGRGEDINTSQITAPNGRGKNINTSQMTAPNGRGEDINTSQITAPNGNEISRVSSGSGYSSWISGQGRLGQGSSEPDSPGSEGWTLSGSDSSGTGELVSVNESSHDSKCQDDGKGPGPGRSSGSSGSSGSPKCQDDSSKNSVLTPQSGDLSPLKPRQRRSSLTDIDALNHTTTSDPQRVWMPPSLFRKPKN